MPVGELLAVLGARVAFAENHWSVVWTSSENQEKRIQGPFPFPFLTLTQNLPPLRKPLQDPYSQGGQCKGHSNPCLCDFGALAEHLNPNF